MSESDEAERTYPLRAATRLTGLSAELLRAWERRYGVVTPMRTPGGTRRYRAKDLERLRLVKAAVDAGHRISAVAKLDADELLARAAGPDRPVNPGLQPILSALDRLDPEETHRLLALQLSAMGPVNFARELALPLVREIGERWAIGRMGIASEHLATSVLRSMLGSALAPTAAARLGPTILFATLAGERHELGLQSAALTAMGAGANPVYLGADLPAADLVSAAGSSRAAAIALSLVTLPRREAELSLAELRAGLPTEVRIWVGGPVAAEISSIDGIERIESLDALEERVALLAFESPRAK